MTGLAKPPFRKTGGMADFSHWNGACYLCLCGLGRVVQERSIMRFLALVLILVAILHLGLLLKLAFAVFLAHDWLAVPRIVPASLCGVS